MAKLGIAKQRSVCFSLGFFERKYGGPDDHKLNIFF